MKPGIYRHFRGKIYRVHFLARHSESLEDMVVYEPLYKSDTKFWVRPLSMFLESVEHGGRTVPRFEFVKEDESLS